MGEITRGLCMIIFLVSIVASAQAVPPELGTATPPEALSVMYIQPKASDGQEKSSLGLLAAVIASGQDMGLFGEVDLENRLWFEVVRSWSTVRQYPRAYILHDIEFLPLAEGSNRLERLSASLMLQTRGENAAIEQRIQYFLNSFTSTKTSLLDTDQVGSYQVHRLLDSRMPHWCVFEWGRVGDFYVFGLGRGSFERIVKVAGRTGGGLYNDGWYTQARQQLHGPQSLVEIYADNKALLDKIGKQAQNRLAGVLQALHLDSSDKMLWALGFSGRALTCYGYLKCGEGNVLKKVGDAATAAHLKFVPAEATWYALINKEPADLWRRLKWAYLELQRPQKQQEIRLSGLEMELALKVDHERDILAHFGNHIIIHNYPLHPLGFPLMCTILVDINGDAQQVKKSLDQIFEYCSLKLDVARLREGRSLFSPALMKSFDGIWYLQEGLYGPALVVTDDYLVISYSPQALRTNFEVPRQPAKEPSTTPPSREPAESDLDDF